MKKSLIVTASLVLVMLLSALSMSAQTPVQWKASVQMTSKNEGYIVLTANIDKGWHMYGFNQDPDGPQSTSIKLAATKGVKFKDKLTMSVAPKEEMDDMFGIKVSYWEGIVTFKRKFKVSSKAATATVTVSYMACNDSNCMPPTTQTFELKLK